MVADIPASSSDLRGIGHCAVLALTVRGRVDIAIEDGQQGRRIEVVELAPVRGPEEGDAADDDEEHRQWRRHAVLKQILDNAVVAEGVDDIFKLAGLERPDIGILSDAFMEEVRQLPQKNLAVELLQKLLQDQVKSRMRTNVVLERKFSERLQDALNRYQSRAVQSAQVIEELIAMAKEFREAAQRGEAMGLNDSELAFYDALADNASAVETMGDETLKAIAREVTEKLRSSTSVDWQKRESVRARLRNLVRITLRRYKYPPEGQEEAIRLVLEQAERLSQEWSAI